MISVYGIPHGPKISKNMNWPGDGGTNVRMTFEDLNDSIKRVTYDGPWALLRLLDESTISQTRRSKRLSCDLFNPWPKSNVASDCKKRE